MIAAANDVKCDVASNSTFVYAYGFAEDIDATHALYASLVVQMVKASDAYVATGAHRPTPDDHRADQLPAGVRGPGRPAARRGPRGGQRRTPNGRRTSRPGTAIALRNKDIELKSFYRAGVRARGTWRATSATAGYSSSARRAGDRAGRRARLGPSTELAGRGQGAGALGSGAPRLATRQGLRRGGVRADAVRPCGHEHGNRSLDFFGANVTLPPEAQVRHGGCRAALRRRRARPSRRARPVARRRRR